MRLEGRTYALEAIPVSENWLAVLEAYVEKYRPDYPEIVADFPPVDEARDQVTVFRLNRG
jgi:hypothetical protein